VIFKLPMVALVVLDLAGCVLVPIGDSATDAERKNFSAPTEVAGVYIYVDQWIGSRGPDVAIDGEVFGQNASLTYLHAELSPGKHSVTVRAGDGDTIEFEAEAGKNYYIWQEDVGWSRLFPRFKLHRVSESEGQKGIKMGRLALPTHQAADRSPETIAGATALGTTALLILLLVPAVGGAAAAAILAFP